MQNPLPNGLLICEKLQGLHVGSGHPPTFHIRLPALSEAVAEAQTPLKSPAAYAGPAPGLPAARDQGKESFLLEWADYNAGT